jgi:hypothetical protein
MSPEKRQEILNSLFSKYLDKTDPKLDCLDGWLDIVGELDKKISKLAPDYKITHIRQRHGLLNFDVKEVSEDVITAVYDHIADAEEQSRYICESCGDYGVEGVLNEIWSVRCPSCAPQGWQAWEVIKDTYGLQ